MSGEVLIPPEPDPGSGGDEARGRVRKGMDGLAALGRSNCRSIRFRACSIRPIALNCKNALFAGSDGGGELSRRSSKPASSSIRSLISAT